MKSHFLRFTCVLMFLILISAATLCAEETTSIDIWKSVVQTEEIVGFFQYLFESIGIVVTDTGEEFTCRHLGDRIEFEPRIDRDGVDYIIEVERFQIERLAAYGSGGDIAPEEQYRVMAEVFTPATRALLAKPELSSRFSRWLAGAERTIHVRLVSPLASEEDVTHTLEYVDREWKVVPGLVGIPKRLYLLDLEGAITFQKVAFATAIRKGPFARLRFSMWYRRWRRDVSERL